MSIMSLGRGNGANGNGNANGKSSKRVEPAPAQYPPRPVIVKKDAETEQVQLGTVTLDAVDRLTGMTADEIERVAEQEPEVAKVEDAPHLGAVEQEIEQETKRIRSGAAP